MIIFSPDLYVGVVTGRHLQPNILVQEVTGETRMSKRLTLLSQEKEEKAAMVTATTVPSLTNQNTAFFKVLKLCFPAPQHKAAN